MLDAYDVLTKILIENKIYLMQNDLLTICFLLDIEYTGCNRFIWQIQLYILMCFVFLICFNSKSIAALQFNYFKLIYSGIRNLNT